MYVMYVLTIYLPIFQGSSSCAHEIPAPVVPDVNDETRWEKVTQPSQVPAIREEDISNYYIYGKNPVTGGRKKCRRHLDRAKKFGMEPKYISEIGVHEDVGGLHVIIKAKVRPSMKRGLYRCHATLIKETGMIVSAHCECKVGATGMCAHVGGVMFRLIHLRNPCTSQLCSWNSPSITKPIEPQKIYDVNWWPGKTNPAKPWPYVYVASPCSAANDEDLFREEVLDGLARVNPNCALYRHHRRSHINIDPFFSTFMTPFMVGDGVDLRAEWVQDLLDDFLDDLVMPVDLSSLVERATRGQGCNPNWKQVRHHLITASNFGSVVTRRAETKPDKLVATLLGYNVVRKTRPMMYGNKYESKARKLYVKHHMKHCCDNVSVVVPGVVVSTEWPFLGASLDGLVTCSNHGTGALEIKCPMKYRY